MIHPGQMLVVRAARRRVVAVASVSVPLTEEMRGNARIDRRRRAGRSACPTRASSIALAAAAQESGLRNLHYGDLDSLGLFQQRPSQGWGTPERGARPGARGDRVLRRRGQPERRTHARACSTSRAGSR